MYHFCDKFGERYYYVTIIMLPPVREGAIETLLLSVHPSIRPLSTQRIIREPKDLACPNLEWRFPTWYATRIPVSRSKGQRSPGPLMLSHIRTRTARPTNFKLGIRMEDDDSHQPQALWPPRSKVKVARSRDQSEPSCPYAVPVSEAGGCIPCRPYPAPTLVTSV